MGTMTRRSLSLSLLCLFGLGCPKFATPVAPSPAASSDLDARPDLLSAALDQGADLAAARDQSSALDAFDQPPAAGPLTFTVWAPQANAVSMVELGARGELLRRWPMRALDGQGALGDRRRARAREPLSV